VGGQAGKENKFVPSWAEKLWRFKDQDRHGKSNAAHVKIGGSYPRTAAAAAAAAGNSRAFPAMLDTAAMPAGKREEETVYNGIFTEFMAG
jgi:hypothetical protein